MLFALSLTVAAATQDDASKKDLERMQGEWQLVAAVRDGQEQPPSELAKMTRTMVKDELTIVVEGAEGVATIKSSIVIDATKSPKTLDSTRTNGPTKGRTALGIYEFDGDLLTTCVAPPGKDRPTELVSRPGSEYVVSKWKRVKAVPTASSRLDPKAVALIKEVGKYFQSAKSIRTEGTIAFVGEAGRRGPDPVQVSFAAEAPNRFRMRSRAANDDKVGVDVVCDGRHIFVSRLNRKEYSEEVAPSSLAEFGASLMTVGIPNAGILFRNLLTDDPADTLMFGVNTAVYAGIERIDDRPAHYLKFTQDDFNWDLWIAAEGKPVVLKMRSIFAGRNAGVVETYLKWQVDSSIPDETFRFTPPDGAKKI